MATEFIFITYLKFISKKWMITKFLQREFLISTKYSILNEKRRRTEYNEKLKSEILHFFIVTNRDRSFSENTK